ncbi:MAG: hypothetical protein MI725_14075 [Pirellulales bacterium]|nr:hypothetical protein [Pirellulales bacterium]
MRFSLRQMLIATTTWCLGLALLTSAFKAGLWLFLIASLFLVIQLAVMQFVVYASNLVDKQTERRRKQREMSQQNLFHVERSRESDIK